MKASTFPGFTFATDAGSSRIVNHRVCSRMPVQPSAVPLLYSPTHGQRMGWHGAPSRPTQATLFVTQKRASCPAMRTFMDGKRQGFLRWHESRCSTACTRARAVVTAISQAHLEIISSGTPDLPPQAVSVVEGDANSNRVSVRHNHGQWALERRGAPHNSRAAQAVPAIGLSTVHVRLTPVPSIRVSETLWWWVTAFVRLPAGRSLTVGNIT